ncbi:hypothetical protein [Streptomyces sp. NPDC001678]
MAPTWPGLALRKDARTVFDSVETSGIDDLTRDRVCAASIIHEPVRWL